MRKVLYPPPNVDTCKYRGCLPEWKRHLLCLRITEICNATVVLSGEHGEWDDHDDMISYLRYLFTQDRSCCAVWDNAQCIFRCHSSITNSSLLSVFMVYSCSFSARCLKTAWMSLWLTWQWLTRTSPTRRPGMLSTKSPGATPPAGSPCPLIQPLMRAW